MPSLRTGARRFKAIPWALMLQGSVVATDHWRSIPETERARLVGLLREARGRPGNLTPKQRQELHELVAKLDLARLGRNMVPVVGRTRRRS